MSGVLLKSTLLPTDFDDCDALGSRPVYYIPTRGPSVPKFQTGAQIFANSCNKERGGE